jgi:hypothetical protein
MVMKAKVCVWIDHKNAFIVFWGGEIKQLESRNYFEDNLYTASVANSLNHYYDEVVSNIAQAESIFIFGLNEAKKQLKARLELKQLINRSARGIADLEKEVLHS